MLGGARAVLGVLPSPLLALPKFKIITTIIIIMAQTDVGRKAVPINAPETFVQITEQTATVK